MNDDSDMSVRVKAYENLCYATMLKWRKYITPELSDEDVYQELMIKAWKALRNYDPSYGFPEKNHVFGAVRNRVKDLMAKRWKNEIPSSDTNVGMLRDQSGDNRPVIEQLHYDKRNTDIINGLPETQQWIAICITSGFTAKETKKHLGLTDSQYAKNLKAVKAHLRFERSS